MRLGDLVHGATFVPMPETAVDEDTGTESHDGQVGRARQSLGMDAITEAMTEEKAPHEHLWSRVLRPDSAHTITALFGCHLICHKPLQFSTINYQLSTINYPCFSVIYFQYLLGMSFSCFFGFMRSRIQIALK